MKNNNRNKNKNLVRTNENIKKYDYTNSSKKNQNSGNDGYGNVYGDEQINEEEQGNIIEEEFVNKENISKTNQNKDKYDFEIIIPCISNENLYPYFCKAGKILAIVFILVVFFPFHFDGYKTFNENEKWTVRDARKMFFEGRYCDAYNCYRLNLKKITYSDRDWTFYVVAETMRKHFCPKDHKRIFFKFPKISLFDRSGDGTKSSDELPEWIKEELYETAEKCFSKRSRVDSFDMSDFNITACYRLCNDFKNAKSNYIKYNDLIEKSVSNR